MPRLCRILDRSVYCSENLCEASSVYILPYGVSVLCMSTSFALFLSFSSLVPRTFVAASGLRWVFNTWSAPTLATLPVQVKRMGWRGLWMTKNIEGTVDDDIAAKLAIGEGRQVRGLPTRNREQKHGRQPFAEHYAFCSLRSRLRIHPNRAI